MRGVRRVRALFVVSAVPLLLATGAACDSCNDVDCGSGVVVQWSADDAIADSAMVRLCIDGECGDAAEPTGSIAPASAPGVDDLDVVLELLDADGGVVRRIEGTGDRRGGCCKSVTFELSADGESLVARD